MDCLVDTNVLLRAADRPHPSCPVARRALRALFRRGQRLCVARQSLLESWVVATRPRDVNGFGYSPAVAADGLSRMQRLFHILSENDELYREWERLVVAYQVVGKAAHDARLVAAMNIHAITRILTFNPTDFRRYSEIEVIHPGDLA